jgi:hypothetical protein
MTILLLMYKDHVAPSSSLSACYVVFLVLFLH